MSTDRQPVRGAHRPRRRPRRRPVDRMGTVRLATVLGSGIIQPPGLLRLQPLDGRQLAWRGGHRLYRLGPTEYASAYAVAGTLDSSTIDFGSPMLLRQGEGTFADPQVQRPHGATTARQPSIRTIRRTSGRSRSWQAQRRRATTCTGSIRSARSFSQRRVRPLKRGSGAPGIRECKRLVPSGAPDGTPTLIINAGRILQTA